MKKIFKYFFKLSINDMTTILIIEDSPSELELMTYFLSDSGYDILQATDGKEALKIAIEKQPNLIVTDVVMPEMSGFELCRNLKINPTTQKVPIVICSYQNQEIDRLWGIKQGADVYITKPYTREHLLDVLKSLVG
jgi:chemotaxis family two-component system response regulator PixH